MPNDLNINVIEGETVDPIEYLSPNAADLEGNTISIAVSGTNDFITSQVIGNQVKLTIYPLKVTLAKIGFYSVSMTLTDDVSTLSTRVSWMINI